MTFRSTARFGPSALTSVAQDRTVHLRVIETTDLHMHLLPYDYYADCHRDGIGLLAAAELIEEARAEAPNALLFDNGDFMQGTPMGDYMAHDRGLTGDNVHPAIGAMNALGFDAIALGNHEFNYGLDFLTRALAHAEFPVVSANLLTAPVARGGRERTLVPPYALLDRVLTDAAGRSHPIRIGVIGLAPPQVIDWDRHCLEGRLWSRDIVDTARSLVPEMREAGADLVLALAHTGIGAARHAEGMENAAVPLARVDGIDALLTGHSHLVFPSPLFSALAEVDVQAGTIAGKPAVMGGCWGSHIGLIDLLMTREGGEWRVLGTRSHTRALQTARGDAPDKPRAPSPANTTRPARMAAVVEAAHQETIAAIRRPVGHAIAPLHSYFTHLGVGATLHLVAEAQRAHVAARLTDPGLRALPMLSAVAPFKSGGRMGPSGYTDVPAGTLALRHIADLYMFPNAIAALRVTGAEVLEWLERSAAAFNRIRPGSSGTLLRNTDVPGYNFEVITGLETTFDLSQPARYDAGGALIDARARRVRQALFDGQPIDSAQHFILCTNSYRASGTGLFSGIDQDNLVFRDGRIIRDILHQHVAQQRDIVPDTHMPFGFVPMPRTTALFETGPGAEAHLGDIARYRPEPRGLTRAGFLRLKIDLSAGI